MKNVFFLMLCSLILQSCVGDDPEDLQVHPQVPANLQLTVSNDNVPADNTSYATISAATALQSNTTVVFTTDKGVFSNGDTTYTAVVMPGESTNAYLRYNKAEIAKVTATISNQDTKETLINFLPAYPDTILVNPAVSTLPAAFTSTTLINTKLIRLNGTVSEGMVVTYRDSIGVPGGGSIGTFLNKTSADAQGNAVVQYWLQDDSYHGFVYIISEVTTNTRVVKGENRIFID